eukprot:jgi/Bigna1/80033/fgenesh1_pg.67_\
MPPSRVAIPLLILLRVQYSSPSHVHAKRLHEHKSSIVIDQFGRHRCNSRLGWLQTRERRRHCGVAGLGRKISRPALSLIPTRPRANSFIFRPPVTTEVIGRKVPVVRGNKEQELGSSTSKAAVRWMEALKPWGIMGLVAAATLAFPVPTGVDQSGWNLLAIFVSVVVGTMVAPLPVGALCLIAVAISTATGSISISAALKDLSSPNMWLVVMAFFIARAIIKSNLGTRISLLLVKLFGQRSIGLAYCMTASELCLGPAIPSVTARSGGVVYPLILSLASTFNSTAESPESARKLGSFLTLNAFQSSAITCAMFATAMASNPQILGFANVFLASVGQTEVAITPGNWAMGSVVPGLVNLAVLPLLTYFLHKPTITRTPQAREMAEEGLSKLGPMKTNEKIVAFTIISMLVAWIGDGRIPGFSLAPTATAFLGVSALLLTKVLSWNDVLGEKGAWDTLIWLSILSSLADGLREKGVIAFFSGKIAAAFAVSGLSPGLAFGLLGAIYLYSHYFFASIGAHVSAMYVSFLTVAVALGVKPLGAALMLGYLSSVMGGLTHFATGAAPVMFGSGYVSLKEWWRVGFLSSLVNLSIWTIVGGSWLKVLGFL